MDEKKGAEPKQPRPQETRVEKDQPTICAACVKAATASGANRTNATANTASLPAAALKPKLFVMMILLIVFRCY